MRRTPLGSRRHHKLAVGLTFAGLLAGAAAGAAAPAAGAAARPAVPTPRTSHARPHFISLGNTLNVSAVSCSRGGYCLLGGEAIGSSGDYGFVATIVDGNVGHYVKVPGMLQVAVMSCPADGWCLAYGFGPTTNGVTDDEVSSVSHGVPGAAIVLGTNLPIRAVGCETPATCFVVGAINSSGLIEPVLNGIPQKSKAKFFNGPLFTALSCPTALNTCAVIGTNNATDKTRKAYVVRINGASISPATAIGGLQAPQGLWCRAEFMCEVSGVNTKSHLGQVEALSHTATSHLETASVPFMLAITCATGTLCASIAFSSGGHWGYVPVTNGVPGSFVDVMPTIASQQLAGIACQAAMHCYAVGFDTENHKRIGVVDRFSL